MFYTANKIVNKVLPEGNFPEHHLHRIVSIICYQNNNT